MRTLLALASAGVFVFAAGCGDDHDDDDGHGDAGTGGADATTGMDASMQQSLYERIGGEAAIRTVVDDFVVRVVGDAKINAYFSNEGLNVTRLKTCLVKQFGALTGGPQSYPKTGEAADADGCRNMKTAHMGMGISRNDFNDLAGHLVDALTAAGVSAADRKTITDALTTATFIADIVEDPNNNATIYQRVGRKPAIKTVVDDFVGRVVGDPKINGYFLNSSVNAARLTTCLVRQVCDVGGGPCAYGRETEPEVGATKCKDMMATHAGMGISTNDFNDLVNHLAMALTQAQVAQADIMSIATVLTSTAVTMAIVEDPNNNASVYQRVGRKPAIQTVVQDFAGRVFMDATINGFFDTSTTAVARLGTCLTSQICSVQGPCKYGQEVVPEVGGTPCRDMMSTHRNITSPRGGGVGSRNIGRADFDALVGHLVAALTAARVPPADRMQYLNALGPMCRDIVSDPMTCP